MLLAIESSCDETSAAVIDGGRVLSNVVASQVRLHAEYGGVVPELATREHLRNLPPVIEQAMKAADAEWDDLSGIAATRGPGLPAALMAGYTTAGTIAFSRGLPFIGIHHHEAHLYSPWVSGNPPVAEWSAIEPHVSLIVSGGHTLLVHVSGALNHRVLGGTLDDAAGECFDKIAKMLRLPYPGGPVLDRLAETGDPTRFDFPRPLIHDANHDFSFSGLKTSVRYFLEKNPELVAVDQSLRDVCAGVRMAVVDVLVEKTMRAAKKLGVRCVTASGGVTCNRELRRRLPAAGISRGWKVRLAESFLCTDNAAMVGILAEQKLRSGHACDSPGEEPRPGWSLEEVRLAG